MDRLGHVGFGIIRLLIGKGNFEIKTLGLTYISQVCKIAQKIIQIWKIILIIHFEIGLIFVLYLVLVTIWMIIN